MLFSLFSTFLYPWCKLHSSTQAPRETCQVQFSLGLIVLRTTISIIISHELHSAIACACFRSKINCLLANSSSSPFYQCPSSIRFVSGVSLQL